MKKPIWSFLNNQFLNSTKKSYRKALKLSIAHDKSLLQKTIDFPLEPKWGIVYVRYHVEHLAFYTAYSNWKASGGSLTGDTQTLRELLKSIPVMFDRWLSAVTPVYNRTSAKFKALFPQGRTPFEHGKIDDKITAINTLSIAMEPDSALAAAKLLVDEDYVALDKARGSQEGIKSSQKSLSETLEAARVSAMIMQYRDIGYLIDNFTNFPKSIESVFDLQTLRSSIQSLFTKTMGTTETYSLTKNTFIATDEIRAKVSKVATATDSVTLYLGSTLGGIDSVGIKILNNAEDKFTAAEFKVDLTINTFLTAVTNGNIESVKLAVELY